MKRFIRDAIVSFVFWTGTLTPYMILVVRVDIPQYLAWVGMQGILVPPLGSVSAMIFRWLDNRKPNLTTRVNPIIRKIAEKYSEG
jgi:hypothetical protein